MLYNFLLEFVEIFGFLNVFKYITFRTGLAVFTSLIIVLILGGPFIEIVSRKKIVDPIRDDGPDDHIIKKIGTPTMGGLMILIGIILSVLMWSNLSNIYILFSLYILISFGVLGALDDYKKIKNNNSSGLSFKFKLLSQIILSVIGLRQVVSRSRAMIPSGKNVRSVLISFSVKLVLSLSLFMKGIYTFVGAMCKAVQSLFTLTDCALNFK